MFLCCTLMVPAAMARGDEGDDAQINPDYQVIESRENSREKIQVRDLDQRGDRIDRRAERTREAGSEGLGNRLERQGDRSDRRADRRSDRIDRRADRQADRIDRRTDRRSERREMRMENHSRRMSRRR